MPGPIYNGPVARVLFIAGRGGRKTPYRFREK